MNQTQPITGLASAREFINFVRDPIASMRSVYDRFGPLAALGPIGFERPARLHFFTAGPELNRQILGDPATFRPTGLFFRGPKNSAQRRIRFGLTRMTGAQHKQQRQLVAPPFHRQSVRGYQDLMVSITSKMLEEWKAGDRRDIYYEMRKLTLEIASSILFSHDPQEALPIGRLIEDWVKRSFAGGVWFLPVNLPLTPYRGLLREAEQIEELILSMIAKRRSEAEKHSDVLSLLIQARDDEQRGMTDTELVGQTTILFMASFETTASALTWTLFLLTQHPRVMRELMTELDGALGGKPPSVEQLAQLTYLDWVVKESMRVLPPVPYTIRATTTTTSIGPHRVREGARIVCSPFVTHHLPELYPEPEKFRPERWRDLDPSQYEYLPFSAGPRMCIGAAFATQLLKVSVSLMLMKFRFEVVPATKINYTIRITMNPKGGLPMRVLRNDRQFTSSAVTGQIRNLVDLP